MIEKPEEVAKKIIEFDETTTKEEADESNTEA